ncbi:hypothetical protein M0R45_035713 [Rubus argutus]|uniref:Aminotransferase-like plant mobile domain-containing protein n=1 Tax=Rubus argutus TaxID=59490 RepID=A0AAW1VVP5_RUBAR
MVRKIQAEELIACGKKVKKDNEFKKMVASKWHTLKTTEKAKFFVASPEASNGNTKQRGNRNQSPTIYTRCSPHRFQQVVSQFSEEQIAAINDMGFGTLIQLSCTRIRHDLCRFLIDSFDTDSSSIELHGKTMEVCYSDFKQIMSVPEGGSTVDLRGSIDEPDMKPLLDIYIGKSGNITIPSLIDKLEGANAADHNFKVSFILLALGTLLCPNTSTNIHLKYLLALRNPENIRHLNWATFSFEFLLDGVQLFKQSNSKYVSGCVLFLQLYYYNVIGYGRTLVDCSKPIIAAWGEVESGKLIK